MMFVSKIRYMKHEAFFPPLNVFISIYTSNSVHCLSNRPCYTISGALLMLCQVNRYFLSEVKNKSTSLTPSYTRLQRDEHATLTLTSSVEFFFFYNPDLMSLINYSHLTCISAAPVYLPDSSSTKKKK